MAVEDFKLAAVYVWKENSGLAWGKETEGGRRGEVGAPTRNLPSSWDFEDNLGVIELTKESDQNKWTFPVAQWLRLFAPNAGGRASIPWQGTKISQAARHAKKINRSRI